MIKLPYSVISFLSFNSWMLLIYISMQSCVSSSILQTAKPLGKRNSEFIFTPSIVYRTDLEDSDPFIIPAGLGPILGAMFNYGLTRKIDFGFQFTIIPGSYLSPRFKYNFYKSKNERLFMSTGLNFSFGEVNNRFYEKSISIPFYLSLGNHEKAHFYLAYRVGTAMQSTDFWKRYSSTEQYQQMKREINLLSYSGGFGVKFGKPTPRFYIEATYFDYQLYNIDTRREVFNGGLETIRYKQQIYNVQLNFGFVLKSRAQRRKEKWVKVD